MGKVATNRANLRYARLLKKRGFATAVHAVRKVHELVNELLKKGWGAKSVSNEINKRYEKEIEAAGLKPISWQSIKTYRDKYWKKTPELSRLVITGDEATQKDIEKVKKGYDAFKGMVKSAKEGDARYTNYKDNFEAKTRLPTKTGTDLLRARYDMHKGNFDAEIQVGVRKRMPTETRVEHSGSIAIDDEVEARDIKEEIAEVKKAIQAIEKKGKYAKPKFTGQPFGRMAQKRSKK